MRRDLHHKLCFRGESVMSDLIWDIGLLCCDPNEGYRLGKFFYGGRGGGNEGGGGGGRHWSFLGVLYFLKSWPCWFPSYLAYRFHQFHASRNARKCKALFGNLHGLASRLATDLHGLASPCIVFERVPIFMQADASLSPFGHPMQVHASFSAVIETFQPMKCPKFPGTMTLYGWPATQRPTRHRSWSLAHTGEKSWNRIRRVPAKRREQSEEESHQKKKHFPEARLTGR